MEKKQEIIYCDTHLYRISDIVCLDPNCTNKANICFLCIKKDHFFCDENLFVTKAELKDRLDIQSFQSQNNELVIKVEEMLNKSIKKLTKSLMNKRDSLLNSFFTISDVKELMDPGVMEKLKGNISVEFDEETKKVLVHFKYDGINSASIDLLNKFETQVQAKMNSYVKDFDKLEFVVVNKFKLSNWVGHRRVLMKQEDKRLLFEREKYDVTEGYFAAVYNIPMKLGSKFKMTVKSVNTTNRSLGFGIIDNYKLELLRETYECSNFKEDCISYFGFGSVGGLEGTMLTTEAGSDCGYREGRECLLELTPEKTIRFYNDEGTIDMRRCLKDSNRTYYLFVILYTAQSSCYVEEVKNE